jgi:LPPG:FO 2-phospho-L-lactate transferase
MQQNPDQRTRSPRITVLCGGVGAARFLRGLTSVVNPATVTAVINVADDMILHGLSVSPDIDTVTYTLAEAIDPERGWGLRDETWAAMDALGRYGNRNWFSLGDRDLGTHLQRTARLHEGATLTEVTHELAEAWGVETTLLPVTNDRVSTHVTRADTDVEIGFQEYFVGEQHGVPVSSIRFDGIEHAAASPETLLAIERADVVVIAPSNPLVSIAPILDVPGIRAALQGMTAPCIAISPIVGGAALKGPAARMLEELGHEASATGVARLWREFTDVLVIDDQDAFRSEEISALGVVPYVTNTIMSDPQRSAALSRAVLSAATLARSVLRPGGSA